MAFRIETSYKVPDARSVTKCGFFNAILSGNKIKRVEITDAYTIDARMNPSQMQKAAELLINPLVENYKIVASSKYHVASKSKFDYAVEISFLPGVTDNVGHTAKETIADGLKYKFKPGENVYSSQVLFITFNKADKSARYSDDVTLITDSLYNPLIQKATIKSFAQYKKDGGMGMNLPKVNLNFKLKADEVDLYVSDEELELIGRLGIPEKAKDLDPGSRKASPGMTNQATIVKRRGPLALGLDELKTIRSYFHKLGRNPTDVELEAIAQTWSEHCKHTIFGDPLDEIKDGIFKHYIKRATDVVKSQRPKVKGQEDFCVSVFKDNSGGIIFDKDYLVTHKVETHNTPSALDPFGGAITGIVGVNRDCLGFGKGAKPIINTYGFCVAAPSDKTELFRDQEQKNKMLSARRIIDGVVSGVNAGGNQSGIPTNSGFLYFDSRYRGKPLVFAGTVGLIPRTINDKPSHIKQARAGDLIAMVGGRVGLDGVHGATFSSEGLSKDSPATAVQIGDPITQKKLSDAIVKEARGQNLYNSITDCGAGGLSSAIGEMAKECGGCEVDLHKIPLKYPGLAPWQIWISESQERMVLSIPPAKWKKFEQLLKKRGVEATVIGKFTTSGHCVVKYHTQTVMDIEMEFLHEGRPVEFQISDSKRSVPIYGPLTTKPINRHATDLKSLILNLLKQPSIASRDFITKQYDHEVQGTSVTKPAQGVGRVDAAATVTRPVLTSNKGVVLSYALFPEYSEHNPYNMAAAAIDAAMRAALCAGANLNHLALLDNFCWPEGNDPFRLWQLKQAAKACFDVATAYGTPFISGKDSMFNDFKGFDENGQLLKISIPPTLLISAISVMNDISKAVTLDAKMSGDLVYLLGETRDEMLGSEYQRTDLGLKIKDLSKTGVPKTNPEKNLKLYQALQKTIDDELIASAIPLTHGGLAVALCKTSIAGNLGMEVNLGSVPIYGPVAEKPINRHATLSTDAILFSESTGRILVTVDPKKAKAFESAMKGNIFAKIGTVTEEKTICINYNNDRIELPLHQAILNYRSTFKNF